MTETFFLYASHVHEGRVDHENVYPDWVVRSKMTDLPAILSEAVEAQDVQSALADLVPPFLGYAALRKELVAYQAVAEKGGCPLVSAGAKIMKGSRGKRVAELRQRLNASGDLSPLAGEDPEFFDRDLETRRADVSEKAWLEGRRTRR